MVAASVWIHSAAAVVGLMGGVGLLVSAFRGKPGLGKRRGLFCVIDLASVAGPEALGAFWR